MSYYDNPAISRSDLLAMRDGYDFFTDMRWVKKTTPRDALVRGIAAHAAATDLAEWSDGFAVIPPGLRRDNRFSAWKKFVAQAGDRQLVRHRDWQAALVVGQRMIQFVGDLVNSDAPRYAECEIYWRDGDSGIDCKARPDIVWRFNDRLVAVDFKSTDEYPTDRAFAKKAKSYGYDFQVAHYSLGLSTEFGLPVHDFIFVVGMCGEPWTVRCFRIDDHDIQAAREQRIALLDGYADYLRSSPRGEEIRTVSLRG